MEKVNPIPGMKVDKSSIISLEKGKMPPQALDLEEAVLGAMMIDKKGIDEVIDILHPDVFYKEAHQHIFEPDIYDRPSGYLPRIALLPV